MRGADIVVESLVNAGVSTVFTLSGNQIMPIFDACIDADIDLVHVRHEAAAVYMAEAWSQLSGGIGVALVTAAPGFANCLCALYAARASESAVLLLSGDSPVVQDGMGAFQELRQTEVSAPIVKSAMRVRSVLDLERDLAAAVGAARSGRPGPVHVALPFDVLNETIEVDGQSVGASRSLWSRRENHFDTGALSRILGLLRGAEKPVVLTGPALNPSRAGDVVDDLCRGLDAPVINMESPRGLKDPCLGDFAGVLADADLVVFLGKPVDFTVNFGRAPAFGGDCEFIVVGAEAELLERARRALGGKLVAACVADVDVAALALSRESVTPSEKRGEWCKRVIAATTERGNTLSAPHPSQRRIMPATLCRVIQSFLDSAQDPILIADGGEFGQWVQAEVTAPTRIINGLAGAIGGCLCYAVAAKIKRPQATVIVLMGDGTAGFHLSEFDTALRQGAPFLAVIGNDARWNAEHQIQLRSYGEDRLIGCELAPTRYDLAAAGLGCHGEYVQRNEELDGAIRRALDSGLPACVNVEIEGLPAPSGSNH